MRHKLAESEELLTLTLEYLKRGGTIKRLPYKEPDEHTIYQLGFMRKWEAEDRSERKQAQRKRQEEDESLEHVINAQE